MNWYKLHIIIVCLISACMFSNSCSYAGFAPVPGSPANNIVFQRTPLPQSPMGTLQSTNPPVPGTSPFTDPTFLSHPPQQEILNKQMEEAIRKQDSNTQPVSNVVTDPTIEGKIESSPEISLFVRNIIVEGCQLLKKEELESVISRYENRQLTFNELNDAVREINNIYLDYGILTALAYLPPQDINDNTVVIKVIEGKIGKIEVTGNKYTRDFYLKSALGEKEGDILYLPEIKKHVLAFNRNNDVKLKARIRKGEEFGTSDIVLEVEEDSPYHLGLSSDNFGSETVGVYKGVVTLEHDSVLGFRDRLSATYGRARATDMVSTTYSVPLGHEGTRIGAGFSYGDIAITKGPAYLTGMGIKGRSFGYTGFITRPLLNSSRFTLSSNIAFNASNSITDYNTFGFSTKNKIRSLVPSLSAMERDSYGQFIHNSNFHIGMKMMGGTDSYFKYTGSLIRLQRLPFNSLLILRTVGQLAFTELPSMEKFGIGGSSSVRGYIEGVLGGDNGYIASGEVRYPLAFLPKRVWKFTPRDSIQGAVFLDTGGTFTRNESSSNVPNALLGFGAGLRIGISKYLTGRIDYGFGMLNRPNMQNGAAKLHFSIDSNPF